MNSPTASSTPGLSSARTSDSLWLYALFALLATAGFFYVNIMGAIVDGLVTGLHFSTTEAGTVGAANIYGASLGALVAVFIVRHVRWKVALASLLSVLLVIDLISIGIHTPTLLTAVRALHGLVGGMAVGVTYSVMARTRSPDRAFGVLLVLQQGLGGLGLMFLPSLVPVYGTQILFLVMAGLTTTALLGMFAIPRTAVWEADGPQLGYQRLDSRSRWTAALTLLALFLFQAGNMSLAAFIIGLGEHYHLERSFIGQSLGWATWIGALGAVLVIMMGTRFGRPRPLLAAMLITLVGIAAFFWSGNLSVFFMANLVTAITWSFVVPYLFGMASAIDASGRMASMAGFASKLGLASGTFAAGMILHWGDYPGLIAVSFVVLALSGVAALVSARRME
jgi:MFS family permease